MKNRTHCGFSLLFFASLLMGGCATQHKDAILFGTNTQVGAKLGVDSNKVPEILIGYNRQESAMVPVLAHAGGALEAAAGRNLDRDSYLLLASKKAKEASVEVDTTQKDAMVSDVKFYVDLVVGRNEAEQDDSKIGEDLSLSKRIVTLVNSLTKDSKSEDLRVLSLLLEVELEKPSVAIRFLEDYKYVATREQRSENEFQLRDAYSVLGTFSAKGSGKAAVETKTTDGSQASTEAEGRIAQYFATGLAAQNLSITPAAVSTSTGAVRESAKFKASSPDEVVVNAGIFDASEAGRDILNAWKPISTTNEKVLLDKIKVKGLEGLSVESLIAGIGGELRVLKKEIYDDNSVSLNRAAVAAILPEDLKIDVALDMYYRPNTAESKAFEQRVSKWLEDNEYGRIDMQTLIDFKVYADVRNQLVKEFNL